MKKLMLLSVVTLIAWTSHAQLSAGKVQVGGAASFNQSGVDDSSPDFTYREFSIIPQVGYFLNDRVSVGLEVGYASSFRSALQVSSNTTQEIKSNAIITGVYARFHSAFSDQFYFFVQPGAAVSIGTTTENTNNIKNRSTSFNIGVSPGFLFMPNERWGFEATVGNLGYTQNRAKALEPVEQEQSQGGHSFGFDLSGGAVQLGVQYYF